MAQQAFLIADQEHLLKHRLNCVRVTADKVRDTREVRYSITGQGFEDDVVFALPLNFTARCDAFGVGEQDYLQQDGGIIGTAPAVSLSY